MAPLKLPIFTRKGLRFRACSAYCAKNFRSDKDLGLCYPATKLVDTDGTFIRFATAEEISMIFNRCVYCQRQPRTARAVAQERRADEQSQTQK